MQANFVIARSYSGAFAVFLLLLGVPSARAQLGPTELAKAVAPFVVKVEVKGVPNSGRNRGHSVLNSGTGFLVSDRGYVITSAHLFASDDGDAFNGVPKITIILEHQDGPPSSFPVDATDLYVDRSADGAILKLPEYSSFKYPAALICDAYLQTGDNLTAFGFPGGLEHASRTGSFDSPNGINNYWQTGIPALPGMSGGPVVLSNGAVVGIVFGGEGQDAATKSVVPLYRLKKLLDIPGVALPKCGVVEPPAAPPPDKGSTPLLDRQIGELYGPLAGLLANGDADWAVFTEQFAGQFGRPNPIQYKIQPIGSVKLGPISIAATRRIGLPMTGAEWTMWMSWVDQHFRPANIAVKTLITNNVGLMIGGVLTPCTRTLLRHYAAFEVNYEKAKADPHLRTWDPEYDWPVCFEPEVQRTLASLAAKRSAAK